MEISHCAYKYAQLLCVMKHNSSNKRAAVDVSLDGRRDILQPCVCKSLGSLPCLPISAQVAHECVLIEEGRGGVWGRCEA